MTARIATVTSSPNKTIDPAAGRLFNFFTFNPQFDRIKARFA